MLTVDRALRAPLDSVEWPATSEGAERLSRVVPEEGIEPTLPLGERDVESHFRVRDDGAISGNSRSCSATHSTRRCLRSLTYANRGHSLVTEKSRVFDLLTPQNNPVCDISPWLAGAVGCGRRRPRRCPARPWRPGHRALATKRELLPGGLRGAFGLQSAGIRPRKGVRPGRAAKNQTDTREGRSQRHPNATASYWTGPRLRRRPVCQEESCCSR